MKVKINSMGQEHLDQVVEIENVSFPLPWKRDTFLFEILLNELADYIVALQNDQVIGYGGMWLILDEAHITNIAVDPVFRGRGVGKQILNELINRAAGRGVKQMTLEVRPSNHIACRLYRKFGFVEKGVRRRYYQDNNEDAIIMWLENMHAKAK